MAGFFGLFGNKTKYVDEPDDNQVDDAQSNEAYFLQPDEAKTLGNIEYMKKPKIIKKTFPKSVAAGEKGESIKSVSSFEEKTLKDNEVSAIKSSQGEGASEVNKERRKPDSSMDMFRKMARDIKK